MCFPIEINGAKNGASFILHVFPCGFASRLKGTCRWLVMWGLDWANVARPTWPSKWLDSRISMPWFYRLPILHTLQTEIAIKCWSRGITFIFTERFNRYWAQHFIGALVKVIMMMEMPNKKANKKPFNRWLTIKWQYCASRKTPLSPAKISIVLLYWSGF